MANEEQVKVLKKGVEPWNKWRDNNPDIKPNLKSASLPNLNLKGANLKNTELHYAVMHNTNLSNANLSASRLDEAQLYSANLKDANLKGSFLNSANFSYSNLENANLEDTQSSNILYTGIQIQDSLTTTTTNSYNGILPATSFQGANLKGANLKGANLKGAILNDSDLRDAILTGACIENWSINVKTNLQNVKCEYVYLKENKQERRPSDPNRNFKPGEFVKLVEKLIETVDLIFLDGIDWQAFLLSFRELQDEYGRKNLDIQGIERKSGNNFVIRIEVPPEAHKAKIEASFSSKYKSLLKAKDGKIKLLSEQKEFYSQQAKSYERQIEVIRRDNTRLIGIVETMVEKESSKVNMTFNAPVNTVAGNIEGNQNVYAPEQKQTIAEAVAEIQKLLKQLEQTNPTATVEQQKAYVDAAISTTLKERCVSALIAGGETAIEEFFDNPFAKVGKAIVGAWIKP